MILKSWSGQREGTSILHGAFIEADVDEQGTYGYRGDNESVLVLK